MCPSLTCRPTQENSICLGGGYRACKSISGHKMLPHVNLLWPGTLPLENATREVKLICSQGQRRMVGDDVLKIATTPPNTFSQSAGARLFVSLHMTLAGCRSNRKVCPSWANNSNNNTTAEQDTKSESFSTAQECLSKLISILECIYGFIVLLIWVFMLPHTINVQPKQKNVNPFRARCEHNDWMSGLGAVFLLRLVHVHVRDAAGRGLWSWKKARLVLKWLIWVKAPLLK